MNRHRITDRGPIQSTGTVISGDARFKLGYGFVFSNVGYLDSTGNCVARSNRGVEVPVYLQEDGPGPRQFFGHNRVQNGACDASLHDDFAESSALCHRFIVMQRVTITTDFSK